jgi:hypothetical protein
MKEKIALKIWVSTGFTLAVLGSLELKAQAGASYVGAPTGAPSIESQSLQETDESLEAQLRLKAKKRLYPGGSDEDALKVQAQLPTVSRKMNPTEEIEVPDSTPQEVD